ncbi:MAG TPA: serine acetyltransferase [Polyangia bacterium]|jgi:serine O-acetyltransferase|nr:serine acetyltransferase [Polyangia bacterium]
MLAELRADLERFTSLAPRSIGRLRLLRSLAETQGVWVIAAYRFGQWANDDAPRALRSVAKAAYLATFKLVEITTGVSLPAHARIGKGLYIGHFGSIVIHPDTMMGERCSISHGVTIGVLGGDREGVPRLGNDVYVGSGAKILGPITVGDGAVIGANAVVLEDVPAGATAVGVPARIIVKQPRSDEPKRIAG